MFILQTSSQAPGDGINSELGEIVASLLQQGRGHSPFDEHTAHNRARHTLAAAALLGGSICQVHVAAGSSMGGCFAHLSADSLFMRLRV
jgi:hypothetical protein